jgi:hypothetical protein
MRQVNLIIQMEDAKKLSTFHFEKEREVTIN